MRKVYKYHLHSKITILRIQPNAIFRSAQLQNNEFMLWFEVDSYKMASDERAFTIYATGELIDDHDTKYLGTVQQGPCVWHIYETSI